METGTRAETEAAGRGGSRRGKQRASAFVSLSSQSHSTPARQSPHQPLPAASAMKAAGPASLCGLLCRAGRGAGPPAPPGGGSCSPHPWASAPGGEAGRAEGSTRASSSPRPEATGNSGTQNRDASSGSQSQAEPAPPGPGLSAHPVGQGWPGAGAWGKPMWAGAHGRTEQSHPTGGRPGGQTYLRSAEWAAMRFLRLLSARGQPDRLKEKRWDTGISPRGEQRRRGGRPTTEHAGQAGPKWGTNLRWEA